MGQRLKGHYYVVSSQLPSLDHLLRFTVLAPCLMAVGASFRLYAYWCVSATALFAAISFDTPRDDRSQRGLTQDQMKIGFFFLFFEGGCSRNARQQIEFVNTSPK
jgi:hypothetical protein